MSISKRELQEIREYLKEHLKVRVERVFNQGDNTLVVSLYFQDGYDDEPIFTSDYDVY